MSLEKLKSLSALSTIIKNESLGKVVAKRPDVANAVFAVLLEIGTAAVWMKSPRR